MIAMKFWLIPTWLQEFEKETGYIKTWRDKMRKWRPQVFAGMVVLGIIAGVSMWLGYEQVAGVCAGGIVAAVTTLSQNGKEA